MTTVQVALPAGFSLYHHPDQDRNFGVRGTDLRAQLALERKIGQCVTLEDPMVEGWLLKRAPYPEDLKGKTVILITSMQYNNESYVTGLEWTNDEVRVIQLWLGHMLGAGCWVLLKN